LFIPTLYTCTIIHQKHLPLSNQSYEDFYDEQQIIQEVFNDINNNNPQKTQEWFEDHKKLINQQLDSDITTMHEPCTPFYKLMLHLGVCITTESPNAQLFEQIALHTFSYANLTIQDPTYGSGFFIAVGTKCISLIIKAFKYLKTDHEMCTIIINEPYHQLNSFIPPYYEKNYTNYTPFHRLIEHIDKEQNDLYKCLLSHLALLFLPFIKSNKDNVIELEQQPIPIAKNIVILAQKLFGELYETN
jgi:hypothetical protein